MQESDSNPNPMQEPSPNSNPNPNRVNQMKNIHVQALELFTHKEKSIEYYVSFYKNGAIKILMQTGNKLERVIFTTKYGINLLDKKGLKNILFDLHIYAGLALCIKKAYDTTKYTLNHITSFSQHKTMADSDSDSETEYNVQMSDELSRLTNKFENTESNYRDLFNGTKKFWQDAPKLNILDMRTIIYQEKPYDMYTERKHEMEEIQNEGLDLFMKKNIDYGDAFAKYGILGVVTRIEDKLQRLASITKNKANLVIDETLNDTMMDLFNYTAMGLMLCEE